MRLLAFMLALSAPAAHADLYRWVDRDTGSVKFSNSPPPWFGDPERARNAPAVEVIRYRGPGAPRPPAAAELPAAALDAIGPLEARRVELARALAALPPSIDFTRAGAGIQRQIDAYQAIVAELDRLDPAGAARRRAQEPAIIDQLRRGLAAQLNKPPAQ